MLTRRRFLESAAATASLAGLGAATCRGLPGAAAAENPFRHGVASGDPLTDRVILWTRVAPPADAAGGAIDVGWEIADAPDFAEPLASGRAQTDAARDFTLKVDPAGLAPGRPFYYRFEALGWRSPVGRTRTAPAAGPERARFAVASCANHPQGFFNAYARIAARDDLDAVLHLGDYLYEYANGGYGDGTALGRVPEPDREITSLADYRARYAQYRRDPDLQAMHAAHPMIAVWDDHESSNDSWRGGAENHQPEEGDWATRKAAAVQAWHEWLPVRAQPGADGRIWRHFRYGDLVDVIMLDTRLAGRDVQAPRDDLAAMNSPARTLLGAEQERWLFERLDASKRDGIAWRMLGQQVPFATWTAPGKVPHPDKWSGYAASRARILDHLAAHEIGDVVILTGDVHSAWALDVPRDPFSQQYDARTGRGSLAVELITPAVSSSVLGSFPGIRERFGAAWGALPHMRFMDLDHRGYLLVDVDRARTRGEWWFVETVAERSDAERMAKALQTARGSGHLAPA